MSNDAEGLWSSLYEPINEKNYSIYTIVTEDPYNKDQSNTEADRTAESELFIETFLKEYGLPHLYYLHRIVCDMMAYAVKYITNHSQVSSRSKLRSFLMHSLKWYPELQKLVICPSLINEINTIKRQHSGTSIKLYESNNATIITSLYHSIVKRIKSDQWNWRMKAEAFIQYGLLGDNLDEEAIVYLCSHDFDCENAIRKLIPKLKKIEKEYRKEQILEFTPEDYKSVATLLRAIQLAGIGKTGYLIEELTATLTITPPSLLESDSPESIASCLKEQIQLLRSDFAVKYLAHKLVAFHLQVQEWLKQALKREAYTGWHPNILPVAENLTLCMAATFLFGQSRLSEAVSDETVVNLSIEHLMSTQHRDGFWWAGENTEPSLRILWTVMIIHALSRTKCHGWRRSVNDASDWLREQQDPFGYWSDDSDKYSYIQLTSLVLEAIDLAAGKDPTTYNLLDREDEKSLGTSATVQSIAKHYGLSERRLNSVLSKKYGKQKGEYKYDMRSKIADGGGTKALYVYHLCSPAVQSVIKKLQEGKRKGETQKKI